MKERVNQSISQEESHKTVSQSRPDSGLDLHSYLFHVRSIADLGEMNERSVLITVLTSATKVSMTEGSLLMTKGSVLMTEGSVLTTEDSVVDTQRVCWTHHIRHPCPQDGRDERSRVGGV